MKKMINGMLAASLFAAAVLAGCAKDKGTDATQVQQGDPTAMELTLSFPALASPKNTRATFDPNATDDEAALKTADVFIYDGSGNFESATHFAPTDFQTAVNDAGNDKYVGKTPIKTKTGNHLVYVGVNLPSTVVDALKGKPESALGSVKQLMAATPAKITTTNGLPMFSKAQVSKSFVASTTGEENRVLVNVMRIVAKITVKQAAAMTQQGDDGTLGKLQWAVSNVNNPFFALTAAAAPFKDPNWETGTYNAAEFYSPDKPADADYIDVDAEATTVKNLKPEYATENTAKDKLRQELTRVTIKGTFIPKNLVTTYSGTGEPTPTTNTATTPATFYSVIGGAGQPTYYFQKQADADSYKTYKGAAAVEKTYTDGVCYWNTLINNPGGHDVVRNDYYNITITSITGPGQETPALSKPTDPAATDTNTMVDVDVQQWTEVKDNVDLKPGN